MILFLPSIVFGADVILKWDANKESDLAGYKIYHGLESRKYDDPVEVGLVTTYTFNDLPSDVTHYFAVNAFDTEGLESDYSNEVRTIKAPKLTIKYMLEIEP